MRDVAIVGAGPSGLHAARRLAESGLDVVVIEARAKIGEGAICSGVIGEEAFRRFDLPTGPVISEIRCIQAISPEGKKLEHRTEALLARVVDKKAFNRALGERALQAGAGLELSRRVESIDREKDFVALCLRSPAGESNILKARVAVIASGVNGTLSRNLGLARPRQYLRAVQAEVAVPPEERPAPTRVYVGRSIAPGAFGWRIPIGQERVRVGVMTTDDPRPYFKTLLRRIAPALDASLIGTAQKGIAQAAVGRTVADRVIAVGEAAGHVKTSTGGGIYYGLMSAEFAVDVLLRAFQKSDFTTQALMDFERYWRSAFRNELLVGFFARGLAGCFSDGLIEKIFEIIRSKDLLSRLNGRIKFDWHQKALLATLRSLMLHSGGLGEV